MQQTTMKSNFQRQTDQIRPDHTRPVRNQKMQEIENKQEIGKSRKSEKVGNRKKWEMGKSRKSKKQEIKKMQEIKK